ncbi:MAG: asparagine--tRNA ligase [Clostridiales bacterium]|nr:asparagine--tRNA ligase [Clostridiales bacterium]
MNNTIKEIFKDSGNLGGNAISLKGWVRTVRSSKNFGFIELNDGSFFKNIQIVFEDGRINNYNEIEKLTVGSAIEIDGVLELTPGSKQPFEVKADAIKVNGLSDREYPLQKKRHSFEYLRSIAHLRPRSNTFSAVFRVRSILAYAIHEFFKQKGFVYVHTPIITGSDCEGAGEMFRVTTLDAKEPPLDDDGNVDYNKDFFARETNLTVSGQLAAETFCMAFGNVYTFGPTFRAENSNTSRHASEFWMIEPEMAFCDLAGDMDVAEEMMKFVIAYVLENAPEEMEFFNKFIEKGLYEKLFNVTSSKFERITYTEAIDILKNSGVEFENPIEWGNDLQTEHERYITEQHFKKPVFVTDYPKEIKAFYMRLNDDDKTVAAVDLLVPGVGEIIGGSQREERYDLLVNRIKEAGMTEEDYWWYLDIRKYGGTEHAGFGLGFERVLMYITGISNIRDVIPFPRVPRHAEF